jgi:DtxR family Mn-dependent transcriptional regulator
MLKRLRAHGLVEGVAGGEIILSPHGRRHAEQLVRRQRLVETLLVQLLEVPWDEVEEEAHRLEHAVSDQFLDRIDSVLCHPRTDPHGDPIPTPVGGHVEAWGACLADVAAGHRFEVERVRRHDVGALRHLDQLGLRPGAHLELIDREPWGGSWWVRVEENLQAVGEDLVRMVYGHVLPREGPGQRRPRGSSAMP